MPVQVSALGVMLGESAFQATNFRCVPHVTACSSRHVVAVSLVTASAGFVVRPLWCTSRPSTLPQACMCACPLLLQGIASIMAAMVPCLRLYAFLACQLAQAFPFADHEYTGGQGRRWWSRWPALC